MANWKNKQVENIKEQIEEIIEMMESDKDMFNEMGNRQLVSIVANYINELKNIK